MAGFEIFAELDPASEASIARMLDPALLDPALVLMLGQSVEDMQKAATDYMYATFQNPTGGVEESWEVQVQGPTLATLTNTAPYAQRLNYGFSGMTDSLGRFFPEWPITAPGGYHWAEAAIAAVTPEVEDVFTLGIGGALGAI